MAKRLQMSRAQRVIWWTFVTVVIAAGLFISAEEVGMANWLIARIGLVGVLAGGGVIFAALIWIASRLED